MITAIAIIHIIFSIGLILIVLLQHGRGSEIGAAFGGGSSQTLFGSSGSTTFMTKLTTGAIAVFMITSFLLAYMYSHRVTTTRVAPVPVEQQQAPAPVKTGN
jgi:preprotein translocase subunit SecG